MAKENCGKNCVFSVNSGSGESFIRNKPNSLDMPSKT